MKIQDVPLYKKFPPKTYTINWGNTNKQGKRTGKMIIGGMSNAPQGKKIYIDLLGNVPEKQTNPDDFRGLTEIDKVDYLHAREYGLNHEKSLDYMYKKMIERSGYYGT